MDKLSIWQNPFFILGATTRDTQQTIMSLFEEKCLIADHDKLLKARADLTNPRTRTAAEIGWLPGLSPKQAFLALESLSVGNSEEKTFDYPELDCANLYASLIELCRQEEKSEYLVEYTISLAYAVESIDAEEVLRHINEDRVVSGFPEVRSIEAVEKELVERRKFYKDVVKRSLNSLPTAKLVDSMIRIVEFATDNGDEPAPVLIDDIVDGYEVEAHEFLCREAENVTKLVYIIRDVAPDGEREVNKVLVKLESVLRNWNKFARPIQLSMKSRGLDHDLSRTMAYQVRSLGIDLWNEHQMLEPSRNLTSLLQDIFVELPEVVDKLVEDTSTLDDLRKQKNKSEQEAEKWAEEIYFNTEIGLIIKDRLTISTEGIRHKNKFFPLDSITKVKWGGKRHSINGIPTGTSFSIYIGTKTDETKIETRNSKIYNEFVEKLWKAVCVNLLLAMVQDLRQGSKYQFGDALVDDFGLEMTRRRLFKSERVYAKWDKIRGWSADGNYNLRIDGENSTSCTLSYAKDNNIHILEAVLGAMFKNGGDRISYLFD